MPTRILKRIKRAIKQYEVCFGVHDVSLKSPVCSRCGYNVSIPMQKQKNRSKSRTRSKKQ
ncbi:hypothetical protein [Microcystis phage MaeS]|nr:hypothetical protein [Microcystis phage MaeS]